MKQLGTGKSIKKSPFDSRCIKRPPLGAAMGRNGMFFKPHNVMGKMLTFY